MNFKKIIIYQYDILFDILDEIKEKFNLNVIKGDEKKIEELKKESSANYLIISSTKISDIAN